MLILKTNPTGIDWYIQQLQNRLHTELIKSWGIAQALYKCYGRADRTQTKDGYTAEVYVGGKEYKEVYWDDSVAAVSFFGISNQIKRNVRSEVDVHLVYFVNLEKLALKDYKGNVIAHRADEEARKSVMNVFGRWAEAFQLQSVDLWLENVLREYPGTRRDDRLKYVDMHPVHCFRLNLKLIFDFNKNC